jgi:tetratricopeptide (TPR) repeat protein
MWKPCIRAGLLAALFLMLGCSPVQTRNGSAISPAAGYASPEIEEKYRQGIELMQARQWQEAESQLQAITEQYPQLAGPWLNLGIARMNLGNNEAAESAFRTAISRDRDNPVAYNELGILYRHSGQLDKALDMYEAALQVAPDYPDTHWNIGILYEMYLSKADLALQHYTRYQQLTDSDDPQLEAWIYILRKKTDAPTKSGV